MQHSDELTLLLLASFSGALGFGLTGGGLFLRHCVRSSSGKVSVNASSEFSESQYNATRSNVV